ncbi:HAD-IIIA family hydrolase [Streptomyces bungoensis]|uniref:HAD-IIIA family hydrolase n=1 Tax=Streptomyces bungoensis TaxID=285568 RepID=UPI000AA81D39
MSTESPLPVQAVLFDRDGTLVADVPYNGDPDRVRLLPGAAGAVALARAAGLATAVVSNQSGIGRGLLNAGQVDAVNARADRLLGGLDTWLYCPHAPDAGCPCRKPRPGLILTAAARLGVPPARCLVIGDIAADIEAAHAAGARAVLVPNPASPRRDHPVRAPHRPRPPDRTAHGARGANQRPGHVPVRALGRAEARWVRRPAGGGDPERRARRRSTGRAPRFPRSRRRPGPPAVLRPCTGRPVRSVGPRLERRGTEPAHGLWREVSRHARLPALQRR